MYNQTSVVTCGNDSKIWIKWAPVIMLWICCAHPSCIHSCKRVVFFFL